MRVQRSADATRNDPRASSAASGVREQLDGRNGAVAMAASRRENESKNLAAGLGNLLSH